MPRRPPSDDNVYGKFARNRLDEIIEDRARADPKGHLSYEDVVKRYNELTGEERTQATIQKLAKSISALTLDWMLQLAKTLNCDPWEFIPGSGPFIPIRGRLVLNTFLQLSDEDQEQAQQIFEIYAARARAKTEKAEIARESVEAAAFTVAPIRAKRPKKRQKKPGNPGKAQTPRLKRGR